MRGIALVLLLAGCAHLEATPNAKVRAEAESRLASCLGLTAGTPVSPSTREQCVEQSRAFCRDSGLEASCGSSGLWTRGSWRSR